MKPKPLSLLPLRHRCKKMEKNKETSERIGNIASGLEEIEQSLRAIYDTLTVTQDLDRALERLDQVERTYQHV